MLLYCHFAISIRVYHGFQLDVKTDNSFGMGTAVEVRGKLVLSRGSNQAVELLVSSQKVLGECDLSVSLSVSIRSLKGNAGPSRGKKKNEYDNIAESRITLYSVNTSLDIFCGNTATFDSRRA